MSAEAVVFEAVSKQYGPVLAVDAVSFGITRGTLVTLLGPSGCGKTSTLRLVAGLEQPSAGKILIAGRDVTWLSAAERDVSMVFQSYALFPHMNVIENVSYGLRASGRSRRDAAGIAAEKLRLVGLDGYASRLPSELSGGQQQRVAVARAIVLEPQVLLFDEPLSNLDAKLRRRVREEIRGLQQQLGLTVIYVTHDQEEALAVSDRIIVMNAGRIAQDGSPRALYEAPNSRFVADFIGDANLLPVCITETANGVARILVGGVTLLLPDIALPEGDAELAVRPGALRLCARAAMADELAGTVQRSAYLGDHMEYEVLIPELPHPLFVTDVATNAPLATGTAVAVSFDMTGVALVPAA